MMTVEQDFTANLHHLMGETFEKPTWNEDTKGGALSIVVHTAHHLGEIRQALWTLK